MSKMGVYKMVMDSDGLVHADKPFLEVLNSLYISIHLFTSSF